MIRLLPHLPFLRKRTCPGTSVVIDGILLAAIAVTIFPDKPLVAALAAVTATLPSWVSELIYFRSDTRIFAPDPLNVDFNSLLSAISDSIDHMTTSDQSDEVIRWLLCPVCNERGGFVPYSIDYDPAKNEISLKSESTRIKAHTSALMRPRIPFPLTVTDKPLAFSFKRGNAKKDIYVTTPHQYQHSWDPTNGGIVRNAVLKITASAAMLIHIAAPESSSLPPERLVIIAALIMFVTVMSAERTS